MIETLKQDLNHVCDLQAEQGFILTGFYLTDADWNLLKDVLSPDQPDAGAAGRYRNVPVFKTSNSENTKRNSYGAIQYAFVKMDIVN